MQRSAIATDTWQVGHIDWQRRIVYVEAVITLPMYVLSNSEGTGLHTVGNDERTLLSLFTSDEKAKQHGAAAGYDDFRVVPIGTLDELRQILTGAGRDGLDEVAFDPVIGSNEFLSCHIPFLFEYLDNADSEGEPTHEDADTATSGSPTDNPTELESPDQ